MDWQVDMRATTHSLDGREITGTISAIHKVDRSCRIQLNESPYGEIYRRLSEIYDPLCSPISPALKQKNRWPYPTVCNAYDRIISLVIHVLSTVVIMRWLSY